MSKFKRNKNSIIKEKALAYLGGKVCFRCGDSTLPICCYDFHHSKGAKEEEISKMIDKGVKFEKLKKELDKCKIICANCHRIIHFSGLIK